MFSVKGGKEVVAARTLWLPVDTPICACCNVRNAVITIIANSFIGYNAMVRSAFHLSKCFSVAWQGVNRQAVGDVFRNAMSGRLIGLPARASAGSGVSGVTIGCAIVCAKRIRD